MRASVAHNKWRVETTTWPALRLPRLGDEALARLAARGNARAFAAVYDRYHQTLYRYCRSILKDDADAQDALQSTFTRALSALQRDQRSAPLRPWLFRIAHNEAISVLRRRRRDEQPLAEAALPVAASAEDQAGARARLEMLLGDLASLPERARSALVMRELSGLSHEEIAVALEISPGAAKQAIFEARRGIAECAEGRVMACADVCRAISDGDRRVLRGRRVRAHLRDCASCSAFAAAIGARQVEMRAIVPVLPAAASAVVLARAVESAIGGGARCGGRRGRDGRRRDGRGRGREHRGQGRRRRDRLQGIRHRVGARHRGGHRRRRGGGGADRCVPAAGEVPFGAGGAVPAPIAARHVAAHATASAPRAPLARALRLCAARRLARAPARAGPPRPVRVLARARSGGRVAPVDGCRTGGVG